MQAVILSAGEGSRIRPLSSSTPKPMLPVADRPLVAHTADAAVAAGASELIFVVGYRGEAVRSYFGSSYAGVPVSYVEQAQQRGTADAVRAAKPRLDGDFAVLNGDNLYSSADVAALFDTGPGIGVKTVADPSSYGVLETDGGVVVSIEEKPDEPPSSLANAGAYVFPAQAREWLDVSESERGEHELTDVLERTLEQYDLQPVEFDRWLDVGRPWELLRANEWKLAELDGRIEGTVSPDATIDGTVVVESGATVESGVSIEGPALVRRGATIGPNAYVRGATLVGRDASIGHAVEVKNSLLLDGAAVNHLSYVGDSVLSYDVNFGAGTTVANLRHDDEPVSVTVKGDRVSTGRRKFGVVVGDGAKTGINTSLDPGVKLSPGATTLPGERVDRDR